MINCLYCNNPVEHILTGVKEHPYPYRRLDKDGNLLESIRKFICEKCEKPTFSSMRKIGNSKGLYNHQVYKQGQYKYEQGMI